MDTYKLMKYFRCATTPEEDAEVDRWLEDDPDGSHAKAYRDAHLIFTGITVHGKKSRAAVKGRGRLRRIVFTVGAAASVVLVSLVSVLATRYETMESLSAKTQTVKVPAGRSMELTLEDGTELWLNAGTEIEYPVVFSRKSRNVRLVSGEVLFDVAKDEGRPFVVETFASDISVLGTRFNVYADEQNKEFSAALLRGSIKVSSRLTDNSEFILEPKDMIRMDNDRLYLDEFDDSGSIDCWTRGLIDVAGVPFDELMHKLERIYDADIVIMTDELPVVRYTWGKIRISEGLDHALSVLAKASDFTWEKDPESGTVLIR